MHLGPARGSTPEKAPTSPVSTALKALGIQLTDYIHALAGYVYAFDHSMRINSSVFHYVFSCAACMYASYLHVFQISLSTYVCMYSPHMYVL